MGSSAGRPPACCLRERRMILRPGARRGTPSCGTPQRPPPAGRYPRGCTRPSCPPRSPSGPWPRSRWRWPCAARRPPCTGCSSACYAALLIWTLGVICRYSVQTQAGLEASLRLVFLGVFTAPTLWLLLAARYARVRRALREPCLDDRAARPLRGRLPRPPHQRRTPPGDAHDELRGARSGRHGLRRAAAVGEHAVVASACSRPLRPFT